MLRHENECRNCAVPGYPCIGSSCPHRNVPRHYCDADDGEYATFNIDGTDCCEMCAEEYMQELFDGLTITEKAKMLNVSLEKFD